MVRWYHFLFLGLLVNLAQAYKIVESKRIMDLAEYVLNKETLVIFDLDEVILQAPQDFSGDLMFSYMVGKGLKRGLSNDDAVEDFVQTYVEIQRNVQMELVEQDAKILIAQLQANHIPTIALTSRCVPIEERTIEMLLNLGIDFSKNAPSSYMLDLTMRQPSFYKKGIIFTGQNHKGKLLLKFLDHLEIVPSRVIFINDKEKYLHQIGESMDERGIDYVGIRYGYTDNDVKNFNPLLAKAQMTAFIKHYGLERYRPKGLYEQGQLPKEQHPPLAAPLA